MLSFCDELLYFRSENKRLITFIFTGQILFESEVRTIQIEMANWLDGKWSNAWCFVIRKTQMNTFDQFDLHEVHDFYLFVEIFDNYDL